MTGRATFKFQVRMKDGTEHISDMLIGGTVFGENRPTLGLRFLDNEGRLTQAAFWHDDIHSVAVLWPRLEPAK